MKNTLKRIKSRLFRPLSRYIDNKIQVELSNMRGEVEDIESKVDNCVSLDWFSEEISEAHTFQELQSEVEELKETIKELKGKDNE